MTTHDADGGPRARFGTVLGVAPGDVHVHSSDYDTADPAELPTRHSFRHYVDGVFMGYKWQCVELARRWLYVNEGLLLDDVGMAYDIFDLRSVRVVGSDERRPLHAFRNGAPRRPEVGAPLIWDEGGQFPHTGHVAVVTAVRDDALHIVEQNHHDALWPEGQGCSRVLHARVGADGSYWVEDGPGETRILGWMLVTDDDEWAEPSVSTPARLFRIATRRVGLRPRHTSWLNEARPVEAAYVTASGGHRLSTREQDALRWLAISESAADTLERATNDLHNLFMHATDYVLEDDALLARFRLPRAIWPRLRASWDNRRNETISGRFDFALTGAGPKVYEYNADSASCHTETGLVQGRWAEHHGVREGRDAGERLHEELVAAWRRAPARGLLHVLQDDDAEETYHARFMTEAATAAGLRCKVLKGMAGLRRREDGEVEDGDGEVVRWVWKTWAWETALDQIRAECEHDEERMRRYEPGAPRRAPLRLVDVLLREGVMVFEPLWTLIPSNKAILPVLWQLFPNHPHLLETSWELTDSLQARGFVRKPIAGRCGEDILLVDPGRDAVRETRGRFARQDVVYQELCPLPVLDGDHVQLCTFTAAGAYAGACVRLDASPIIRSESDLVALRVLADDAPDFAAD